MSGESEKRHMGLHCTNSQLINQTQEQGQTVVTCSVQWVCHVNNKSPYRSRCVFSTQRTGIFRPQNSLAYAYSMKQGCSEMIQSVSPHRVARNTSFSITHYWLLIIVLIPCLLVLFSLDVLRSLSGAGLPAEIFGWVKFRKDRVKIQIWG